MLSLLLAAPLWLQGGLGSLTLFGQAPPRMGLMQSGALTGRAGYWLSDRVALVGRLRAGIGGTLSLNIDGTPNPPETTGPIALAVAGPAARLSPWGGSFVELAIDGGGIGWQTWHPAVGGSLSFGCTWWNGTARWGIEAFMMGGGGDEVGYFGTGIAVTVGGARPGDRAK